MRHCLRSSDRWCLSVFFFMLLVLAWVTAEHDKQALSLAANDHIACL